MRRLATVLFVIACNTDPVATADGTGSTSEAMPMTDDGSSSETGVAESSTSGAESTSTGTGTPPDEDCGNGMIDPGELCDGDAVVEEGVTCQSLGYLDGELRCGDDCRWDESTCTPPGCGNGTLEPGEDCDGAYIREGITCGSLGFIWERGSLSCAADCTVDTSQCIACGYAPDPVGGECPSVCNGGCTEDTCVIDCSAGQCFDSTYPPIECPDGWNCDVLCADGDVGGCIGRTIECPPEYRCAIECVSSGCTFADIRCSDGPCEIACDEDEYACLTQLACGTNECHASCAGSGQPSMGCYLSCDCQTC